MSGKNKKDMNMSATIVMIAVVAVLCIMVYIHISRLIENRCLQRLDEGVSTAVAEINQKLNRDSQILNATASLIASSTNIDSADIKTDEISRIINVISPLLATKRIQVLMPDNTIYDPNGEIIDVHGRISFAEEALLGEHISNRDISLTDDKSPVIRHYVPIKKDGKTVAMLYGVTYLEELPDELNIENIYNASSSVFIIDTDNGEFIMDTWHPSLGSIKDFAVRETKGKESWSECVDDILVGKKGHILMRSNTTKKWTYLYYSPVGTNNWSLSVAVPEEVAMANLYAIRKVFIVFAIFMMLTSLFYYLWVRHNAKLHTKREVEQAVLEEKLHKAEAAERAKTMFLSNMSHDIRTPMNAIIGFTTLAEANIDDRARVQDYLAKILSSGNHLLSLINDVLDMSRIESGKLNIEETECCISDIFRDMRNIIQSQMQAKQLNFFMDTLDVMDENVYCDKLHLNQVLLNLLSNAIKFTPAGGSVSLTVSQLIGSPKGYGEYEIRVKDTGIGMSKEFQKHIFEPFERERNSTVSGIQGTGLGMPITKSIIDAMDGSITLNSEEGKGTEFIIKLDLQVVPDSTKDVRIHELEGLRALVVDDSFATCDSLTKMLMKIGMRSEWTLYGKEAILRAKQAIEMGDEFYVYIIDWSMPDLNGAEVARQIRTFVSDTVPIIILTAYDLSEVHEELADINITAMCNKPLFMSELRDTLISIIEKEGAPLESEPVIPLSEGLKGKRLLLVEDNELNREIAEEILRESGFEVESAEDGTVAVDMVRNSEPGYYSLILMDVQMPIMDGYEATKAIRALDNKALAEIPIVAMTANAFDSDRKAAIESGMNDHITKPIDVQALTETISRILLNK